MASSCVVGGRRIRELNENNMKRYIDERRRQQSAQTRQSDALRRSHKEQCDNLNTEMDRVSTNQLLSHSLIYTVSQKKRHPFCFCDIFVKFHPILLIFGRNMPQEIWNKHSCTAHRTSFHMFVLYRVKSSTDFYGIR